MFRNYDIICIDIFIQDMYICIYIYIYIYVYTHIERERYRYYIPNMCVT